MACMTLMGCDPGFSVTVDVRTKDGGLAPRNVVTELECDMGGGRGVRLSDGGLEVSGLGCISPSCVLAVKVDGGTIVRRDGMSGCTEAVTRRFCGEESCSAAHYRIVLEWGESRGRWTRNQVEKSERLPQLDRVSEKTDHRVVRSLHALLFACDAIRDCSSRFKGGELLWLQLVHIHGQTGLSEFLGQRRSPRPRGIQVDVDQSAEVTRNLNVSAPKQAAPRFPKRSSEVSEFKKHVLAGAGSRITLSIRSADIVWRRDDDRERALRCGVLELLDDCLSLTWEVAQNHRLQP